MTAPHSVQNFAPNSAILVLGVGPLPVENAPRLYAPGLRTWSFAQNLAEAGHQVVCATADFGGMNFATQGLGRLRIGAGSVEFHKLPFDVKKIAKEINALYKAIDQKNSVACAVSTTDLMNLALAQSRLPVPVWLDYNGHPMVERQMQAAVHGSDAGVQSQWDYVLPALLTGDRFSTCSTPQKHALIGELGAAGRLNRFTAPVDLVEAIQPVRQPREFAARDKKLREKICGPDGFILLWTSGYNTWSDIDTLFAALEQVLARYPNFHYLSTGGKIDGHDEVTFPRFLQLVERSPHRSRYHFAGWVENAALADYYATADAAINLDVATYEALLGHRNRVQEWIEAGVPVISTALSEITKKLAAANLLVSVPPHDPNQLAESLNWMIEHRQLLKQRAQQTKAWHDENYSAGKLLAPLRAWCAAPQPAPDLPAPASRPNCKWSGPQNELALSYRKYLRSNKLLV